MNEAPAPGLAVAVLTETDASGRGYRRQADRPLSGYALVTQNERDCRLYLLMENGRPLTSRTAGEGFYYEAWLMTGGDPVSLGAFNAGADGEAGGEYILPSSHPTDLPAHGVRITAEPFGGSVSGYRPVLEGELLWLTSPAPAETRAVAPAEPAANDSAPPHTGNEPGSATPAASEPFMSQLSPAEPFTPERSVPDPYAQDQLQPALRGQARLTPVHPTAPGGDDRAEMNATRPVAVAVGENEEQAEATPDRPVLEEVTERTPGPEHTRTTPEHTRTTPEPDLARIELEPPSPPDAAPVPLRVPLTARHPLTPRASGNAMLDFQENRLTVTLRALPTPAALGREPSTDRPFNVYQVWLLQQRSGTRMPLGFCTRLWGDNWRFEGEEIPLARYDAVLITADDRSAQAVNTASPQVLLGSYKRPGRG